MWQDDAANPLDDAEHGFGEEPGAADFSRLRPEPTGPAAQPTREVAFPPIVSLGDLYRAARARAVADHELSLLFNPEYDI